MNRYLATMIPTIAVFATPVVAQPMAPKEYIATAGASDLYERQSSQLVLTSTRDPKVRSFAAMMIKHHTQSTADVKAAAMRARIAAPPPMLMPLQVDMIAQLRAADGPARDNLYIAQQRAAHGQALNVQQAYATGGTAPPLRAAAAKIVPVVQHHIMMLKTM